ncbi:10170_t:CDS:2, partial [Dentiscutata erythropus]
FKSSVGISDKTLIKIASSYPNLKHFNLWDNRMITDKRLCQIAQSCNKLEYLNISYCNAYWITDRTYLDFAHVMAFRNDSLIVAIIESSPNLKYFDISGNDIGDEVVEAVASTCYELEYLDLGGCGFITELSICNVIRSCPKLQHFELGFCDISDKTIKEIACSCPNLKYLDLDGWISMCSNKLLKKIGGIISRKLTPEEKDSKFVKEETTAPLGLTIILPIFISNIKNNACLSNKKSITIPTKVLIEKSNSKTSNYILLGNNWFYGRKYNNDELQTYIPEIVIDTEDAFVRTTLHIHDFYKILPGKSKDSLYRRSNISTTSDSSTSNVDSISSSGIEVIYMKRPILKRKVK